MSKFLAGAACNEFNSGRRDILAKSFAAASSLLLPAFARASDTNLFQADFYFPKEFGMSRVSRRIYLTREASPWHAAERADFLLWQRDGRIDVEGYKLFCWFLRDVRNNRVVQVDMRLAALLSALQSRFGFHGKEPAYYHLTSGYRSWQTNDLTEGAAANSGHVYAGAADGWLAGVSIDNLAGAALSYGLGGVGLYKKRGFVHTDVVGKANLWKA